MRLLKIRLFILFLISIFLIPDIILSKEIEKIFSFNQEFDLIINNGILEDITGDFERDLIGLFYKNIKIYYEENLEFSDYEIVFKDFRKYNLKLIPDIKFGSGVLEEIDLEKITFNNLIFYGNHEKEGIRFLLFKYYPIIYDNQSQVSYILKGFDIKIKFKIRYLPLSSSGLKQSQTYLIIGKNELRETVDFFIKKRTEDGFNVIYKPIEDFSVGDIRVNIRNFLKDNLRRLNIKYLLLIGGSNEIPYFRVYPYKNRFVLTDFFYGELSSDLDLDKDGKLGEPYEDKIDFYSEISVGRIPSSDVNFVRDVLERSLKFETQEYKKSILSLGAIWNFETTILPFTDGALSLNVIFEETFKKNGFSTLILSEKEGLRTSDISNISLTYENFIFYQNYLKPSLILWQGHGYFNSTFRKVWLEDLNKNGRFEENEAREIKFVDTDSIIYFNKEFPSIVFMGSCDNMRGIENSIAFSFIRNFATAVIAATDTAYYGIGWSSLKDGWLQSMMHVFSDYLKDGNDVSFSLIKAKEYYYEKFISPIQIEESFANIYVFNIFGPPEISLKVLNKVIRTNSAVVNENEILRINFNRDLNYNSIKGLIEFDINVLKLFRIESKNNLNYSLLDGGKIIFRIDRIINDELFSISFFGRLPQETKIIMRGVVTDEKVFYDIIESEKIYIIKRRYSKFDFNDDGKIDAVDLIEFSKYFGTYFGDKDYRDYCDFNMDGRIDGLDLIEFSLNFGKIFK